MKMQIRGAFARALGLCWSCALVVDLGPVAAGRVPRSHRVLGPARSGPPLVMVGSFRVTPDGGTALVTQH